MHRKLTSLTSALLALVLLTVDNHAAKTPADQPATATFRCAALVANCPAFALPDGIRGDGSPYAAVLNSNRELRLELLSGGGRTIWLDFTNGPACLTGCRRTFDTLFLDSVLVQTNVVDASGAEVSNGLLSIPVGGSSHARLKIAFNTLNATGQTVLWAVRFNPETYPGSDHVTVTRTAANTWEVEAMGSDRALLVSSILRKNGSELQEGPFFMPFRITVVSP